MVCIILQNIYEYQIIVHLKLRRSDVGYISVKLGKKNHGALSVVQWDQSLQHQDTGLVPGWAQWLKRLRHCHSCSVGRTCVLDVSPGEGPPHASGLLKRKKKLATMTRRINYTSVKE